MRKNNRLTKKEHLIKIIEQYPIPMVIVDSDDNLEYLNNKFIESYGYVLDDISPAEKWWNAAYPDKEYRAKAIKEWRDAVEKAAVNGGEMATQQWDIRCKDGSVRHIEFDMKPIDDGAVVTLYDITESINEIRTLRDSEARFKTLLEKYPLPTAIADTNGNIEYFNKRFTKSFGYSTDDISTAEQWWNTVYPDVKYRRTVRQSWEKAVEKAANTGNQIETQKWDITCKDGTVRHVEFDMTPIDGGSIISMNDITDRKQAEAELRQAQKMESVGRLAGGIAHDFNNMLGVILGYSEMAIKDVNPTTPLYEQLNAIHNAASRSATLTKQLLGFAGKQAITPKIIDLNDAIECTQRMLQQLTGENINLVWRINPEIWPIKMDPAQISQILANLCINAKNAITDIGKVTIETKNITINEAFCANNTKFTAGEYVLLTVSDNGCGMDKNTLDNIFDPFFSTKTLANSSGMGLPAVHGIVKQNNGIIDIHSKMREGTTIEIYLPRYIIKKNMVHEKPPTYKDGHEHESILLVDDELVILKVTAEILKSHGYTVLTATTPKEAIKLAQKHGADIDLLITDVIMPDMNGRDLADKILVSSPNIKCLFMSGYTADVITRHGVLDDGIHFIRKPFLSKPLCKKVRETLDSK